VGVFVYQQEARSVGPADDDGDVCPCPADAQSRDAAADPANAVVPRGRGARAEGPRAPARREQASRQRPLRRSGRGVRRVGGWRPHGRERGRGRLERV
jgi:hypothetical protein